MMWHKISECVPEKYSNFTKFSKDVLIYSPTIGVDIGSYYNNGEGSCWFYKGKEWLDVSHWTELPLPPVIEE